MSTTNPPVIHASQRFIPHGEGEVLRPDVMRAASLALLDVMRDPRIIGLDPTGSMVRIDVSIIPNEWRKKD